MSNTYTPRPSTDWKLHKNFVDSEISVAGLHPIQHADIIRERERKVAEIGISKFKLTRLPAGTPTTYEEFQPRTQALNGKGGQGRKKAISKPSRPSSSVTQSG